MLKIVSIGIALALGLSVNTVSPPPAFACPPGLAKKNPPCVPPGLAKKRYEADRYHDRGDRYRRGDRIRGDYIIIEDPYRYGLNRGDSYARIGNYVYRIDRETREVLDLIGAVAAILN